MSALIWLVAPTAVALLALWGYLEWDLRRYRRKLAARNREAQRLHEAEMRLRGQEFCDWMDETLARHFEEYPR